MTNEGQAPLFAPYLRGVGQIMLQNSSLTGLLFVLGIAINSLLLTAGLVTGVVVGTLTAKVLKYDDEAIGNGLYGFNAALVGISMLVFFESTVQVWVALVLLSIVSTIMMNLFVRKQVPAFTFPFVFLLWIALYVFRHWLPVDPPAEEDLAGLIEYSATLRRHQVQRS
jgi:urea transporter